MDAEKNTNAQDMPQTSSLVSIRQLTTEPSIPLWKREIALIVNGLRPEKVIPLGSIEQYIRVLLAESKDIITSETCFREALYQTLQEWNPRWDEPEQSLEAMLSLTLGFTPTVGFSKVMKFLNSQDIDRLEKKEFSINSSKPVDLYLKALRTLAAYYPSAPHHSRDDLGFVAYINLLDKFSKSEIYAGHAVCRLVELNALQTDSDRFKDLISQNPAIFYDLIPFLLSKGSVSGEVDAISKMLGHIFVFTCKGPQELIDVFMGAIHRVNAYIENDAEYGETYRPTIKLANSSVIPIHLNMEDMEKYALYLYRASFYHTLSKVLESSQSTEIMERQLKALYLQAIKFGPGVLKELESHLESSGLNRLVQNDGLLIYYRDQKFEIALPLTYFDPYLEYYYLSQDPKTEVENTLSFYSVGGAT